MWRKRGLIVFAMALWAPTAHAYVFKERPCADASLRCGTVDVPENYAKPGGRHIALSVVVFPALRGPNREVAQYDLEGGPGFDVTFSAGFYATDGEAYRRERDVVLADQRGTGKSHPLYCPGLETRTGPMYPPDLVKACADELGRDADLAQYSTANSARDIDAIRQALGYERLSLNALSYGTTLALRYIADYGAHVHSAVLMGVVPADRTPPRYHAPAAYAALKLVIADCAADAACAKSFPDLEGDIARVPAAARAMFFEKLRTAMYAPAKLKDVPFLLHRAAFEQAGEPPARVASTGLYLSITCSESFAHMDVDAAVAASAATPFGAYRLERQRAACAAWPHGETDTALLDPVTSDVPVLLISGAFDPVSPPEWAAAVAANFPNSRHVVVPRGSHVLDGLSGLDTCLDVQVLSFVDTRGKLDASCFAQMRNEPYRTE